MSQTLEDYLDRIAAIVARAEPLLAAATPTGVAALTLARAEQARVLTAYQLFVHRELFEPMIASGDADLIGRVRALKVECILLGEEFRAFARVWTSDGMERDWATYRAAAQGFAARIAAHVRNVGALAIPVAQGRVVHGAL